jgi:hypothetical protein
MFDQSMVVTGGGGNTMVRSCGKRDCATFDLDFWLWEKRRRRRRRSEVYARHHGDVRNW